MSTLRFTGLRFLDDNHIAVSVRTETRERSMLRLSRAEALDLMRWLRGFFGLVSDSGTTLDHPVPPPADRAEPRAPP